MKSKENWMKLWAHSAGRFSDRQTIGYRIASSSLMAEGIYVLSNEFRVLSENSELTTCNSKLWGPQRPRRRKPPETFMNVLEQGHIYFFYRPRVETHEPESV